MKKIILTLLPLIFAQSPLSCSVSTLFIGEVEAIDRAILASEKRLASQREIKNLMLELRRLEEGVVKEENPKELAARMVAMSKKILTRIQEEHMESLFSSAYLEELRFYSSFARKTQLAHDQSN